MAEPPKQDAGEDSQSSDEGDAISEGEKLFALTVRPLLREKCYGCHSNDADELKGAFDLSSRSKLLEGGDAFGESVVFPGDAESSSLMAMIAREEVGYEMPPKESEQLTKEEIWAVRDWINEGAPWPDDQRVAEIYKRYAEGVTVTTSGGQSEQWTNRKYDPANLWAFQPIRREFSIELDPSTSNPIDQFIQRAMESEDIEAAPRASRAAFIRRATFDLLGLPPTPKEVAAYVDDPRNDDEATADLIERLLASPHYGEQWARHWLDVVRYADSSGFANDWQRPNAWRYRDYVIRAFNDDKPFDHFVVEQIAGDELYEMIHDPSVKREEIRSIHDGALEMQDDELLVAAGFLRMGPWEHTGMSVAKITRQQFLDDITDAVGQVFLGQALQCCRCHDHKFDPIPTRDYYSVQSVFATTQFAEVETDWIEEENLSGMEQDARYHQKQRDANDAMMQEIAQLQRQREREWFKEKGLPYKTKAEAKKAGVKDELLPNKSLKSPDEFGRERIGRKWQKRFDWEQDRYEPYAFTVYSGKTPPAKNVTSRIEKPDNPKQKGTLEQTVILPGGDPFGKGEAVEPGVLSAVPGGLDFEVPETISGRRLALAQWITHPENSLTPRVLANRIWAFHFGRGIAGNPNNFGATGKKPTHPELLDWLAQQLINNGWSIKHMHRVIMNSEAYRRSTQHPEHDQLRELDPNSESYAVFMPRRLEAEEIRDSMLKISGELNPEMGGLPIRPDMNLEAALQPRMIMGTFAPSYVPSPQPEQRHRRSIYALRLRGHRMPFMETFNQPGSEKSCELRDSSNITPQVFALFNGQEAYDRALALADRVLRENKSRFDRSAFSGDSDAVIKRLFELVYTREPTDREIAATRKHWKRMLERQQQQQPQSAELPLEVTREAVDENTGKPFTFTERLFVYEDYKPDLQPDQVDAVTRALGDVALAMLNSNEFIYLY